MEKYRLVEKRTGVGKEFLEKGSYCEIRIRQQGKPKNYISFAMEHYVSLSISRLQLLLQVNLLCIRRVEHCSSRLVASSNHRFAQQHQISSLHRHPFIGPNNVDGCIDG
mmetsp:Transcript_4291/g.11224  ORF Transcript_4291/g.11224 Transcript_4291/m.11224 type:complete len:109 (+) Transcript_4291:603-929(+)